MHKISQLRISLSKWRLVRKFNLEMGSRDYKFLNPRSRDWKFNPGIAINILKPWWDELGQFIFPRLIEAVQILHSLTSLWLSSFFLSFSSTPNSLDHIFSSYIPGLPMYALGSQCNCDFFIMVGGRCCNWSRHWWTVRFYKYRQVFFGFISVWI